MCEICLENSYSIEYFLIVRVFNDGNPLNSVLDQLLLLTFNLRAESKPIRRQIMTRFGKRWLTGKGSGNRGKRRRRVRVTIGAPPPTSNWYSV